MADGLLIAAPASGSGKTVITLGLLRALRNRGVKVASAKVGPDYIDPRFHEAATGTSCFNLDCWAMTRDIVKGLISKLAGELLIVEGVMGLFDGPERGRGSTADLAEDLGLPIVLVIDTSHQAQSIVALVHGFANFRKGVGIAGIILNRVASPRHREVLLAALKPVGIPVVGLVPQSEQLALPSRHLGLVQAEETKNLEAFITAAAKLSAETIDLDRLSELARPCPIARFNPVLNPLGQHVAVARDEAFAFAYPHLLESWRALGAELSFFSPLADEQPHAGADAIFLPGGYPELHAGRIASASGFLTGLRQSSALIYGECGGYMVLGDYLVDATATRHKMAGILPLGTSFANRKLHLGYRKIENLGALPFSPNLHGHEFHYSTVDWQGEADPLFKACDAAGRELGHMGLRRGKAMGSFAHVIA